MVSVDVAEATLGAPTKRRGHGRPALIAALVGVVAVGVLAFTRPDTRATNLDAASIQVDGPQGYTADAEVAVPTAAVTAPKPGSYASRNTSRIEGTTTGGRTTTDRKSAIEVRTVEGAPADGATYVMISARALQARNIVAFKDDGIFIVARDSLGDEGCVFDQPIKRWSNPMEVGSSWTSSGSCTQTMRGRGGSFTREATITVDSRVTGTKKVTVGAAELSTFVMESSITTVEKVKVRDNEQLVTRVEREVQLFSPEIGLPVQLSTNAALVNRAGTQETTTRATTGVTLLATQPGGA